MRPPKAPPTHLKCPHCKRPLEEVNGAYLRWCRERAKVPQTVLARVLGKRSGHLSLIEHNLRRCPPKILEAYEALRAVHPVPKSKKMEIVPK